MTEDIDWGNVPAYKPGSNRFWYYGSSKSDVWPSVEEQVKDAQKHNLERSFSGSHEHVQLYMSADDCDHENPETSDKYFGVEDLLQEWMEEHYPEYAGDNPNLRQSLNLDGERSDYWKWYDRKWELQQQGRKEIPLYVEFDATQEEYEDNHNYVCLLEPMETCCKYCNADELEYGEGVSENHCDYGSRDLAEEELWACVDYDYWKRRTRDTPTEHA